MVYFLLATAVAVLGYSFARSATPGVVEALNGFSNIAGLASRIFTAVDALRVLTEWQVAGAPGRGPLSVPAPVQAHFMGSGSPQPLNMKQRITPVAAHPFSGVVSPIPGDTRVDPYEDDPIGRELGLPPKMDTSKPGVFFGPNR